MKRLVFAGPSLTNEDRQEFSELTLLPPVSQGDVFRSLVLRPCAIGIIDGYFDGSPAVWHKEILYAISLGVCVYGAASMGALRAAELHSFGMIGIGHVFEAYRDGRLTDDDEVALIHGPAEAGYANLSLPMADIRATIQAAKLEGVIGASLAEHICDIAKKIYYPDRQWNKIFDDLTRRENIDQINRLWFWLNCNKISVKRQDARLLLKTMTEQSRQDHRSSASNFFFEHTEMWDKGAKSFCSSTPTFNQGSATSSIFDELRLLPEAYEEVSRIAALLVLAQQNPNPRRAKTNFSEGQFREEHKLLSNLKLEEWLRANEMTRDEFDLLTVGEQSAEDLVTEIATAHPWALLQAMRLSGHYPRLAARARAKAEVLDSIGLSEPSPQEFGLFRYHLFEWYFADRLGREVPEDFESFHKKLGLASQGELTMLIARELGFLQCTSPK